MDVVRQQMNEAWVYFSDRGFKEASGSWHRSVIVQRLDGLSGTDVYMIVVDETTHKWCATFGQTYQNNVRWRSPGFPDPVSAYVYAELNQWGM